MDIAMYAGFSDILREKGAEEAAQRAAALGCSCVELLEIVGRPSVINSVDEAKLLADTLRRYGLRVSCFSVVVNLWQRGMSSDDVTEAEKILMHYVDIAKHTGAPYFHHTLTAGAHREELLLEEALELIVPVAVRIAKYAYSLGLITLYEDQGHQFNGINGYGRFYRAVKKECPYVGVCGDTGNMLFVDEDPVKFFETFAGDMKHVHIKDYHISTQEQNDKGWSQSISGVYLKDSVIGEGDIDLCGCFDALKRVGYSGVFSLENCHGGDLDEGVRQGIAVIEKYFAG